MYYITQTSAALYCPPTSSSFVSSHILFFVLRVLAMSQLSHGLVGSCLISFLLTAFYQLVHGRDHHIARISQKCFQFSLNQIVEFLNLVMEQKFMQFNK